jgi:Protein of unknown function (DUF4235)
MNTVATKTKEMGMSVRGFAHSRLELNQAAKRNGRIGQLVKAGSTRVQARVQQDIRREAVMHRLLSLGTGILGGAVAGAIVSRVWGLFSDRDEVLDPTAGDLHFREALAAGAVQGLVFGVVKAALARGTAKTYHRLVGSARS